ncbi:uncharacterized protein CC84DRAFT_1215334 [Paraphaeosphaeria sporulosa]|uniref:DNA2/NAM7 helicase-like C-terminal domain-containing protein n=1 Tax=Paraphaeosphaeria sporulosa TaxID=1460663 RepID=A0A177CNU2_9PLEO|nr:uncharacterized protein CC84DRAFT_1215334 [Paraphaeosphaeria sporulosa]OAG08871.1 hypothetical protein CC84DRAFT_1215334 [Paraphaeosphaeria sporulosa]
MSDDTRKTMKATFKVGFWHVVGRAPALCTTPAATASSGFQVHRRAVTYCLEEAGRAPDLEIMGMCSKSGTSTAVGDRRQLGPQAYSSQLDKLFLRNTRHLRWFQNAALLELCQRLHDAEGIRENPGALNNVTKHRAKSTSLRIRGIRSTIVVLNIEDVAPTRDATGSCYCVETSLTTMHDLINRLRHVSGDDIMIVTPYNARVRLLGAM